MVVAAVGRRPLVARKGAACMAAQRDPARQWITRMLSNTGVTRRRRSRSEPPCATIFGKLKNFSKRLANKSSFPKEITNRARRHVRSDIRKAAEMATKTKLPDGVDPSIDADKVVRDLARTGFANILDFARVGEDGEFHIDADKAREVGATASVVTRKVGRGKNAKDVRRMSIKMPNKLRALKLLLKNLDPSPKRAISTGS